MMGESVGARKFLTQSLQIPFVSAIPEPVPSTLNARSLFGNALLPVCHSCYGILDTWNRPPHLIYFIAQHRQGLKASSE
jgi:hypothetical protein